MVNSPCVCKVVYPAWCHNITDCHVRNYVFGMPLQHFAAVCGILRGFAVFCVCLLLHRLRVWPCKYLYVGISYEGLLFKISINAVVIVSARQHLYAMDITTPSFSL